MQVTIRPTNPQGTITIPPSKSMAHRLLICAAMADGTSTIHNIETSNDIQATLDCLKALGAQIEEENKEIKKEENKKERNTTTLKIQGTNPTQRTMPVILPCQESGSTLRFLLPIAAAAKAQATLTGSPRLMERPMGVYANLFEEQDLKFIQNQTEIEIQGPLESGLFQIPGNVSSQFISGLLFAATQMEGQTILAILPPYESHSYVDLTIEALKQFKAQINQPTPYAYEIQQQILQPAQATVEGDASQAAFWLVLGALKGQVEIKGLNPNSRQGDMEILTILKKAGCEIKEEKKNEETILTPQKCQPKGQEINLQNIPDLGPILCVLGAMSEGTTTITHAQRLRMKESDRIQAMEDELKKAGVHIETTEDTITIVGKQENKIEKNKEKTKEKEENNKIQQPIVFSGHNDHRIVMALAIYAICAGIPCTITDAQAVNKSYPSFWDDLKQLNIEVLQ